MACSCTRSSTAQCKYYFCAVMCVLTHG